jgi:hypothetical protein
MRECGARRVDGGTVEVQVVRATPRMAVAAARLRTGSSVARVRAADGGGAVARGRRRGGVRVAEQWRASGDNAVARVGGKGGDARCTSRRRGGVWEAEGGKTEETSGGARTRKIYDMWPPRIFLSPVDPTLRVQTSVDCVGVVYQGLYQICVYTPVKPML